MNKYRKYAGREYGVHSALTLIDCDRCGTRRPNPGQDAETTCPSCGPAGEHPTTSLESGGQSAESASTHRVLVAEDNSGIRELYCLWMADEPRWALREVENGAEALAELDDTYDVLVLDRNMPELTGGAVVARLNETTFDGKVLVVSGDKPDEDLREAQVNGYLTKPVRRETLLKTLGELVIDNDAR